MRPGRVSGAVVGPQELHPHSCVVGDRHGDQIPLSCVGSLERAARAASGCYGPAIRASAASCCHQLRFQ
jgi:hypothetical protein